MAVSSINLRVYSKDWAKLRRIFPAQRGETVAHYLERFVSELELADYAELDRLRRKNDNSQK